MQDCGGFTGAMAWGETGAVYVLPAAVGKHCQSISLFVLSKHQGQLMVYQVGIH